ncbi:MAG: thiamine pyrophosphate-dependent enzyme [Acidimicrobiales bacterium]
MSSDVATSTSAVDTYRAMYTAREFDDVTIALQRQGAVAGYAPARGQEASHVGVASQLGPEDMLFPSYRQPGAGLVMGVTPQELWRFHGRYSYTPWDWRQRRFFTYTIPVGSQLAHAVGWAIEQRHRGAETVSVVFFGDGASSQGEVHEAMNMAGVFSAPTVFVCENNGWAISLPTARQTAASSLYVRALGYGFAGQRVDGNDVSAVQTAVSGAIARARAGFGPTLLELETYRLGPHTTSDDPGLYRSEATVEGRRLRDPVVAERRRLVTDVGLADDEVDEIENSVEAELRVAAAEYLQEVGDE